MCEWCDQGQPEKHELSMSLQEALAKYGPKVKNQIKHAAEVAPQESLLRTDAEP
jgi:hypothetical protein